MSHGPVSAAYPPSFRWCGRYAGAFVVRQADACRSSIRRRSADRSRSCSTSSSSSTTSPKPSPRTPNRDPSGKSSNSSPARASRSRWWSHSLKLVLGLASGLLDELQPVNASQSTSTANPNWQFPQSGPSPRSRRSSLGNQLITVSSPRVVTSPTSRFPADVAEQGGA